MLAFGEARARLLASARRLPSERVALGEASGRVLAEDLVAQEPLPAFAHSAMDGYAVATADLGGHGPWNLPVAGESRAGRAAPPLPPGAACRILTGAPIPARADAVVMQEHVAREGDTVRVEAAPKAGQHIRRVGEDLAAGSTAIRAGTRLTPGGLALAAMLDRSHLVVSRRPRLVIVCTGDELRPAGSVSRPASIPESNGVALAALAAQAAATAVIAPTVADDAEATAQSIVCALEAADVLLTVGGVSVGDHDVVREALGRAGVTVDFWKVAIKPGKPIVVGTSEGAHVLGLPGNPASALITFAVFGMPLLRAMQGDAHPLPIPLRVRMPKARKRSPDRLELVRATLVPDGDGLTADVHDNQSSGTATSLAHSDGLALVPPGSHKLDAGSVVDLVRWSDV
jgi:molybdopterin molybdotransferase